MRHVHAFCFALTRPSRIAISFGNARIRGAIDGFARNHAGPKHGYQSVVDTASLRSLISAVNTTVANVHLYNYPCGSPQTGLHKMY